MRICHAIFRRYVLIYMDEIFKELEVWKPSFEGKHQGNQLNCTKEGIIRKGVDE